MDMEEIYAAIIAKHGPLFMNLKYFERLNLDDTSLVREKWTTELFEREVEVMPIILENEQYFQQDDDGGHVFNGIESSFSRLSCENCIPSIPSGKDLGIAIEDMNPNCELQKPSCSEAWCISLKDDTESGHPGRLHLIPESSTEMNVMNKSGSPKSPILSSIIFEKWCSGSKAETSAAGEVEMEMLFEKVSDQVESNKETSSFLVSPEKYPQELKSGRISRPLSGRYSSMEKDEKCSKYVKRTDSIMDLTCYEEEGNLSLSSLYDELCRNIGDKQKSNSTRPNIASLNSELWRNPHSE